MVRKIALEEHFLDPATEPYWRPTMVDVAPQKTAQLYSCLTDFGEQRLQMMEKFGIARAVLAIGASVVDMPRISAFDGAQDTAQLRRWLRRYHSAHVNEAAMLRVWLDAARQDPALRAETAPLLDWGRRRMSAYLEPRGFGDVDSEALVLVALLGVFGSRRRPAPEIDAAAHIIERGLLALDPVGMEHQ